MLARPDATAHPRPLVRPSVHPVIVWAGLGVLSLGIGAYAFIGWMLSLEFVPTRPPVAIESAFVRGALFWSQVLGVVLTLACLWFYIVRPKLQTGRFSFIGLLSLASLSTYWVDPLSNYYSFGIAYSSGLWNFGSWANFIPGYSYPGMQRFPEAPLIIGSTYIWFNVGFPLMFAAIWRWLDRRFPRLGAASVFAALLIFMGLFDMVQELFYLRLEIYSYVGAPHRWSLFGGTHYQFPLFIGVITAFFFMGMTYLIYSRDDKGLSFAERGVLQLKLSNRAQTFVRFLALTGACWVVVMVTYFIPVQWMYTHGDVIPADTPAHLLNDLCGPKAGFACPGPGVPIPRRDGIAGRSTP